MWAKNKHVHTSIDVHIDGVELSKSSSKGGYTILGRFRSPPKYQPFLIGAYVGYHQPDNFDLFLVDLVRDLLVGCREGKN